MFRSNSSINVKPVRRGRELFVVGKREGESFEIKFPFNPVSTTIQTCLFCQNNLYAVLDSNRQQLAIFNLEHGNIVLRMINIVAIAVPPDNGYSSVLAIGHRDGEVFLWSGITKKGLKILDVADQIKDIDFEILDPLLCIDSNMTKIAGSANDGEYVIIWDISQNPDTTLLIQNRSLQPLLGKNLNIKSMFFHQEIHNKLCIVDRSGAVIWCRTDSGHVEKLDKVPFSDDFARVNTIVPCAFPGGVSLVSTGSARNPANPQVNRRYDSTLYRFTFSHDMRLELMCDAYHAARGVKLKDTYDPERGVLCCYEDGVENTELREEVGFWLSTEDEYQAISEKIEFEYFVMLMNVRIELHNGLVLNGYLSTVYSEATQSQITCEFM